MKKQIFRQSLIAALILFLGATALVGCDSDNGQVVPEPEAETVETTEAPTEAETVGETEAPTEDETVEETNDSEGYLFGDDNFTMEVAEGWTIEEIAGMSFILAPNGMSNVNVVAEGMQGLSLDEYVDISLGILIETFPDLELLMDEEFEVHGRAGVVIAYISGMIEAYVTYQFFIEVNNVAYIITYTSIGEVDLVDDVAAMVDTFIAR